MANELIIIDQQQLQYENELLKLTVLGGIRLEGLDRMRVTVKLEIKESPRPPLRHTVDLYNDTQLEKFIRKAAEKLEIGTTIIAASLSELTEKLEQYRLEQIKQQNENNKPKVKPLTKEQRSEAEIFLQQPNLLQATNEMKAQPRTKPLLTIRERKVQALSTLAKKNKSNDYCRTHKSSSFYPKPLLQNTAFGTIRLITGCTK